MPACPFPSADALPLVTITVPTYNQERYIERAIRSCLAQDYPHLEVIVSDDCSTDATYDIASAVNDPRLRVVRTPANVGRVKNYRYALYELANGAWVVNLDGDDYYSDPTFISEAIRLLKQHPSVVMYACGASSLDEQSGRIHPSPILLTKPLTIVHGLDYVLNFYKWGTIGQHFSVLYNRALALETDFYSLDSLGADTDSICRLALRGDVLIHKKWVGVWTSHGGNASYSLSVHNLQKEHAMLERIAAAAKQNADARRIKKWLDDSKNLKNVNLAVSILPGMSFGAAASYLVKNWVWHNQMVKEAIKTVQRALLTKRRG